MNIQDFYRYATFSTLAYVDWRESSKLVPKDAIDDANNANRVPGDAVGAIDTLGEKIFIQDGWRIADFQPNTATGFAASLFANSATGEKVLAIRGTEPNGIQAYTDLLKADLQEIGEYGMAISQAVSLFNYVRRLQAPAAKSDVLQLQLQITLWPPSTGNYLTVLDIPPRFISVVAHYDGRGLGELIKPEDNVVVTGHSLGGHLAAVAYRMFPGLFDAGVTYNAPGFDPALGVSNSVGFNLVSLGRKLTDEFVNDLFAPYLSEPPAPSFSALPNMYSMVSEDTEPGNDTSIVSSAWITGVPPSTRQPITTERNSHMIEPLMDALAVQSLFEQMNPDIGVAGAGALVLAASNNAGKSEEELLDALSKLLLGDKPKIADTPNDVADGLDAWINPGDFVKRTTIHNRIIELEQKIKGIPGLSLVSLVGTSQSTLLGKASQASAEGIATRYALKELNPFAITGDASLYDPHNTNGELDLYDPATGSGNLTDLYLADRAALLAWKNKLNIEDITDGLGKYYQSPEWYFEDTGSDTKIWLANPLYFNPTATDTMVQVKFGQDTAESLKGGTLGDHLYGGAGNDTLNGGAGSDHLEGQAGDDELKGEDGRDTLLGGQGNDTLDGGKGDDYLEGGAGNDLYRLAAGDGNDTLIDADGAGGIEVDGTPLEGGDYVTQGQWEKNGVKYTFNPDGSGEGELIIRSAAGITTVKGFRNEQLGITLAGAPAPGPVPVVDLTIAGDLAPIDFDTTVFKQMSFMNDFSMKSAA